MASPLPFEELWHSALVNYGLERPSENTEIHVFRVILQTSLDKTACTRSVTSAGPVNCTRSVMFVGTSVDVFPKTFWIKVTFRALI